MTDVASDELTGKIAVTRIATRPPQFSNNPLQDRKTTCFLKPARQVG